MNKVVNEYIPLAMAELKDYIAAINKESRDKDKKIPKEFKGYISSLGAGLIMSGLVPTLAVYAAKGEGSKADRSPITKMIFTMIKAREAAARQKMFGTITDSTLFEFSLSLAEADKPKLEQEIVNASIALKLCLRTFELTKN